MISETIALPIKKKHYKPAEARAALVQWVQTLIALWTENADTIYAKRCEVKLDQITPKEKAAAGFLAEISASLPDIQLGPPGRLPTEYGQRLKNEIAQQIQKLADFRFGSKAVELSMRGSSIRLMLFVVVVTAKQAMTAGGITATVAGGYKFIIDYDKFRKNCPLFIADIRRAAGKIKQ